MDRDKSVPRPNGTIVPTIPDDRCGQVVEAHLFRFLMTIEIPSS